MELEQARINGVPNNATTFLFNTGSYFAGVSKTSNKTMNIYHACTTVACL